MDPAPIGRLSTDEWDDSLDRNAAGRWETRQARRRDNQLQGKWEECCQVHRRRGTDSCESGGLADVSICMYCTYKLSIDGQGRKREDLSVARELSDPCAESNP